MGNSFDKFAGNGDGSYADSTRRGWSRRRRRHMPGSTSTSATLAPTEAAAPDSADCNVHVRQRLLTHVSSTPNFGGASRVRVLVSLSVCLCACLCVCVCQLCTQAQPRSLSHTLTLSLSFSTLETTVNDALEPRSSSFSYAVNIYYSI